MAVFYPLYWSNHGRTELIQTSSPVPNASLVFPHPVGPANQWIVGAILPSCCLFLSYISFNPCLNLQYISGFSSINAPKVALFSMRFLRSVRFPGSLVGTLPASNILPSFLQYAMLASSLTTISLCAVSEMFVLIQLAFFAVLKMICAWKWLRCVSGHISLPMQT